jgi:tetratricopeptide (TPR) repeat protein
MRVAKHLCTTVITEARHLGLEPWLAHPLYVQGLLARDNGDFRQAQRAIEESLVRLSHTNDLALIAQCQHFLGELSLLRGDMSGAHFHLEQSLRLSQQASIIRRVAATQRLLADLARLEGRYEDAQQLCYTALEVVSRLGDRPLYARLLLSQAQLAVRLGQMQTAVELLRGAQATYADIEDARGVVWTSLLLARAYLSQGRWSNALQNIVVAMKKAPAAGLMHPRGIIGMLRRWTSE